MNLSSHKNNMNNSNTHIHCPDCASKNTFFIGNISDDGNFAGTPLSESLKMGSLYRCTNCNLKFKYPVADTETYNSLYDNNFTETWDSPTLRYDQQKVLENLPKLTEEKILDYGCYSGGLLEHIQSNYKYGIEVNSSAAKRATEVSGATVYRDVESMPTWLIFDRVIAMDVIEHMVSPRKFLEKLLSVTNDNGSIYITTWDADNFLWGIHKENWWYSSFNKHIAFVSRKWFDYFAPVLGYEMMEISKYRYEKRTILNIIRYILRLCIRIFSFGQDRGVEKILYRFFWIIYKSNYMWMTMSKDHLFIHLKKLSPKS